MSKNARVRELQEAARQVAEKVGEPAPTVELVSRSFKEGLIDLTDRLRISHIANERFTLDQLRFGMTVAMVLRARGRKSKTDRMVTWGVGSALGALAVWHLTAPSAGSLWALLAGVGAVIFVFAIKPLFGNTALVEYVYVEALKLTGDYEAAKGYLHGVREIRTEQAGGKLEPQSAAWFTRVEAAIERTAKKL